jgi:hypothetical protein
MMAVGVLSSKCIRCTLEVLPGCCVIMRAGGNTHMANKKEFTIQDMKKAFLAGERIGYGPIGFHRWVRVEYEARYIRKPKRKAA